MRREASETSKPEQRPLLGLLLMTAAMVILPVMDASAKFMSVALPIVELVWARFFFHTAVLTPIVLARHRPSELWPQRPLLQTIRAMTIVVATASFFAGLRTTPLADMLAVFFVYPFIVTAFAPFVLGDRVGIWRWTATAIGFIGALIIIRPGFAELTPGVGFALLSGCCYSFYSLSTRKLAGSDPPLVTLFYTGAVGLVATSSLLPFVWVWPGPTHWLLMLAIGLVSAIGHACVIVASERAPAPLLAPLAYIEIVSATLLGYFIFGDLPRPTTWIGMAVIVASGLVIVWRERVRGVRRPVDEPSV